MVDVALCVLPRLALRISWKNRHGVSVAEYQTMFSVLPGQRRPVSGHRSFLLQESLLLRGRQIRMRKLVRETLQVRNSRRRIFPTGLFGNESLNSTCRGTL